MVRRNRLETLVFTAFFCFSVILMFKTFGVVGGDLKIASKAWSDFAATIPLIRSFSLGDNFPPEYPIFPGVPIRYHFVFFFLVGMLEKFGIRIDWALNGLSTVAFFALAVAIYFLAKEVFGKKSVAVLSVVLFAFNGSFSFLEFFKTHLIAINTFGEIISNTQFPSFGPYDGKIVSAFWNLNIYTNQRHLALAYAAFLALVLIIHRASQNPKMLTRTKTILLGLAIGIFPFIHTAVFGMMGLALIIFFFIYPQLRLKIFTIGAVAIFLAFPQISYIGASPVNFSYFNPGYLVDKPTLENLFVYWLSNLGLAAFLAPLGFLVAKRWQRKIFLPFLFLFVVGNLFQFTPDLPTNHKFFNLFIIGANLFVANYLVHLWKKGLVLKATVLILLFFLTFSGIIDIFPIFNDVYVQIPDYRNNPAANFIFLKTPKDSVFLNSSFLYNPASLAGRKIFMGWPYFAWSAGYDTDKSGKTMEKIYTSRERGEICKLLKENDLDYFTVEDTSRDPNYPDIDVGFFEREFKSIYKDKTLEIFNTSQNCDAI